jgi:release factor glutamine methyltransferase
MRWALSEPLWPPIPKFPFPPPAGETLEALLDRRRAGEPVAFLLGRREFYGRSFEVGPAALVPRPETEHLVDAALAGLPAGAARFIDLGTGGGCLAVTLVLERPAWKGTALDIAPEALDLARRNAERLGAVSRLDFALADFTAPGCGESLPGDFHLAISNPPYVSEEEYRDLSPAVRLYEPRGALVSGPTGLEHARAVLEFAARILPPGGLLLMEHGATRGEAVRGLCPPALWENISTGLDLAGRDRFLAAARR